MLDFGIDYLSFIYPFFPLFFYIFNIFVAFKILNYMKRKEQSNQEIKVLLKEISIAVSQQKK